MKLNTELNFPVSVDGATFLALRALARHADIKYATAYKRKKRGYSPYEIVHGKVKPVVSALPHPRKVCGNLRMIGGVAYANLPVAYEALKPSATLNAVLGRLRDGWTPEQAFEIELKIDGRRIRNNNQASASSNADSEVRVTHRRRMLRQPLEVNGISYESVSKLARAYGRSPKLVTLRIKRYGWTPERAVTDGTYEPVEIDGVSFDSAHAAYILFSKRNGLSYSTFCSRQKRGLSLKISLGLEPLPKKMKVWFDGKSYASKKELAEAFGLTVGALHGRLRKMKLRAALNFVAPPNGRYSLAYFAKYPKVAASSGRLYFVRIDTKNGRLQKIGITLNEVRVRLACKFELVAEFQGRMDDLFQIEQEVIARFSGHHERAEETFEGKTETFNLTPELEAAVVAAISELHYKKMN